MHGNYNSEIGNQNTLTLVAVLPSPRAPPPVFELVRLVGEPLWSPSLSRLDYYFLLFRLIDEPTDPSFYVYSGLISPAFYEGFLLSCYELKPETASPSPPFFSYNFD